MGTPRSASLSQSTTRVWLTASSHKLGRSETRAESLDADLDRLAAGSNRVGAVSNGAVANAGGVMAGEAGQGAAGGAVVGTMAGDATLFAREDYVEEAWRIVDPVLHAATPVYAYEAHTWGPREVEHKLAPSGGWDNPIVTGTAQSMTKCNPDETWKKL